MSGSPFPDDSIVKAERYVRSTAAQKIPFFCRNKTKKRLLSGEGVYSWTIVTDEDTFVSTPFEKMKLSEASSAKKAINKPFIKRFANDRD